MFVCTNQLNRAESLLADIEKIKTPDMIPISSNECIRICIEDDFSPQNIFEQCVSKILLNVYFSRQEVNCIPIHLQREMYASSSGDDKRECKQARSPDTKHLEKEFVMVAIEPFLYYLQYRSATESHKQKVAIRQLLQYCKQCFCVSERLTCLVTFWNLSIECLVRLMSTSFPYKFNLVTMLHIGICFDFFDNTCTE
ncbi:hypothetical protein DPMN_038189 [Dreissena polymorpha]|uniref:Uncharacterized protein n=1 Tax=Dreissena polymorpha TaxID=45954 RepID=A0A9D4MGH1_DREPO|nr:hypothetical protein DPMN_038189 [Dreissena polymorpha]